MDNEVVRKAIADVEQIEDPWERMREAHYLSEYLGIAVIQVYETRRAALKELTDADVKHATIARALGVTRGRVGQLVRSAGHPDESFFGQGQITIVDDIYTYRDDHDRPSQILAEYLSSLNLTTHIEKTFRVSDVNRRNLVALTHEDNVLIHQIAAGDPVLSVEHDDSEWALTDSSRDARFVSELDGDSYAYLARLPRPDRKGNFLCIYGLSEDAVFGAVGWLKRNVSLLRTTVKNDLFSVILQRDYDWDTHSFSAVPVSDICKWGDHQ